MGRRLEGKVAVITGMASGIGEASAILFAREGAKVVGADISPRGQEVVDRIRQEGGEAVFVQVDLRREEDCRRMIDTAIERYGRLDILFNNAGVITAATVDETSNEDYERMFAVNVRAIFWACKYAVPIFKRQGGGVILNTASKVGISAQPGTAVYCATKGAVVQLTGAMALDYAKYNIRVNALCPGTIETPLLEPELRKYGPAKRREWEAGIPMGRLGKPEECAYAALFLCSDEASFITGVNLPVDGGFLAQ